MPAPGEQHVDVLVVGGGIAGLSVAAELAGDRRVAVIEAEHTPAMHTTGRSAAQFIPAYAGPAVQPFTAASRDWFTDGGGYADEPLLSPRGMLIVSAPGDDAHGMLADDGEPITVGEAAELFPALRPGRVATARYEPAVSDIDVAGAVAAFRRALRDRGGVIACDQRLLSATRPGAPGSDGGWRADTADTTWNAGVLVDAAGAWGDEVAAACGVAPVGLRPLRRTACTFVAPEGVDTRDWAFLRDASDRWYLKPEPGQFMASPADETPDRPGDARPEEEDIARALDHIRENTTLPARSITSSWAGLRTFAPDRALVLGSDPEEPAFVWCVGQGGFGIQTSPGVARTVAALVRTGTVPPDLATAGVCPAIFTPARLRPARGTAAG
jgi:D-arginine dehydrogenase